MTRPVTPRDRELLPSAFGAVARPCARSGRPVPPRHSPRKNVHAARPAAGRQSRTATGRGKYLYCIIESTELLRFGSIGIGAAPSEVYTVHYQRLAAVVSDIPLAILDATRESVLAHERVNQAVLREHTLIPMSFGTVFRTRADVVEFLRSTAEELAAVLDKMQNKVEFGLKVLWDHDQAVREVQRENEDIRRRMKEIAGPGGGTHFARMEYGRLVDAALVSRADRYVVDIIRQLRELAVAWRVNKPIGDKMILNAAFLIARDREAAFDDKLKGIAGNLDSLTFKCTGPWPPYNFANIHLKLERA